jgi:hypothetical protein
VSGRYPPPPCGSALSLIRRLSKATAAEVYSRSRRERNPALSLDEALLSVMQSCLTPAERSLKQMNDVHLHKSRLVIRVFVDTGE